MDENARVVIEAASKPSFLGSVLEHMRQHGQSIALGWGEDDGLWVCSWVTSGTRFTGVGTAPLEAVVNAVISAAPHSPTEGAQS